MKIDINNKTVGGFTYEFLRGISLEYVGAAEFGECMETINRVKDGNFNSWISEWASTANRVSKYAEKELNSDDKISAKMHFFEQVTITVWLYFMLHIPIQDIPNYGKAAKNVSII